MTGRNLFIAAVTVLTGWSFPGLGQTDSVGKLINRFNRFRNSVVEEKLFIHTDRTFYLTGETMWFKLYSRDASFHKPLDLSKVAYVEVLDLDKKPVAQAKIEMNEGTGSGWLFLPATMNSGNYLLRTYTTWMRNFGPELYGQQTITVVNPFVKVGLKPHDDKPSYDVQFFPEGGTLVQGVKGVVGFRVVDKNGSGIDFSGSLLDERNDTVARFAPLKFGLGNFTFTPSGSHQYKAVIKDIKNRVVYASLPAIEESGYVMHLSDTSSNRIKIAVTAQFAQGKEPSPVVYLLAHTRMVIVTAKTNYLQQGKAVFLVDKKDLGEGVSHFTLFSDNMVPVCERLYFKQPASSLRIDVQTTQKLFVARGKIELNLHAHTAEKPEAANMSVSVFKMDSLPNGGAGEIQSYLWLTSELKGAIESPEFYLTSTGAIVDEAINNLMLTQGWSRFKWKDLLKESAPSLEFVPEYQGQMLRGRVLNTQTGAPVNGIGAYLSTPGKNVRLYLSRSDKEGKIQFEIRDVFGMRKMILQSNYLVDSTSRIELASPYSETVSNYPMRAFDLPEDLKNEIVDRNLQMQVQNTFHKDSSHLFVNPSIDSIAFYGKPDESYRLDDFTRFSTMEEVMREYVIGVMVRKRKGKFHFLTVNTANKTIFKSDPLVLLDGLPVFDVDKIMNYDPRKVAKVDVLAQRYYLGHSTFDGVVSYTTYKGDLLDFPVTPELLMLNYEGLQIKREFFSPQYESQSQRDSRVPDTRNLLHWAPNVNTDLTGKQQLSFYASDVTGKYKVVVQGITKQGKAGSAVYTFEVTQRDNP